MPQEEVFDVSRITENALFWLQGTDLKHKLIVIAEREGSTGATTLAACSNPKETKVACTAEK